MRNLAKSHQLLQRYLDAVNAVYYHVGLEPKLSTYPISDCTEYYWRLNGNKVRYAEIEEDLDNEDGTDFFSNAYFEEEIFLHPQYEKWIYEGEELTLFITNPNIENMKFFSIFANDKRCAGK